MSDKTLSQRLRELKAAIQGGNNAHARKLVHECIAQAEAQEAKSGEYEVGRDPVSIALARNNASLMEWRGEKTKASAPKMLTDDEIDRVTDSLGLGSRGRASFRAGLRYARDHNYLKPSQAIGEQTPVAWMTASGSVVNAETRGRWLLFEEPGEDFWRRKQDLYAIPLYRSPVSSDARDSAIEAAEYLRDYSRSTSPELVSKYAEDILSALRG